MQRDISRWSLNGMFNHMTFGYRLCMNDAADHIKASVNKLETDIAINLRTSGMVP